MVRKIVRCILEYLVLNDIYKIIYDLGGCDSQDNWCNGWDHAINAVEDQINKLIDEKFG